MGCRCMMFQLDMYSRDEGAACLAETIRRNRSRGGGGGGEDKNKNNVGAMRWA